MHGKNILLIIGGGIAAYKCLDLVRRLKERGASVRAILTDAATQFITPLSVSALTEEKCFTDLFDLKDEAEIGHIQLSRDADLLVVAPATADLLARMAQGLAGDLATSVLLATDTPVLAAPAMNVRMWEHPATHRNILTLQQDGIQFVGPNEGDMACGEYGFGRMAEPEEILDAIEATFSAAEEKLLSGRNVLLTSGPTQEPIDPVRYLSNHSSGKQGIALAAAAARLGATTTIISGPTNLPDPPGVTVIPVQTADEMLKTARNALPADILICAAAVSDWRVREQAPQKLKRQSSGKTVRRLELVENPDILKTLSKMKGGRPKLVIGFAAETENVEENALKKRKAKGCDWIVANDVSDRSGVSGGVMGGDRNRILLVSAAGVEYWPEMTKEDVADRLLRRAADYFDGPAKQKRLAAE
ncbi:MAG: bifunctional phosphopantothenoylcysteine decarboxylase/phosphopantothenate--cysteine ligase CoaBC [Methyloligellaceae bacterium]